VNKSGGYVKCKKSGQPKNKQSYGDYRKHVGNHLLCKSLARIIQQRPDITDE
jgi:hypothetical protein